MRFPGRRRATHYFPASERGRIAFQERVDRPSIYIVGIDQLLVDIEALVDDSLLQILGIPKGQSVILEDTVVDHVYSQLKQEVRMVGEFAGGTVGNTLHNYAVLADDRAVLLGAITSEFTVGDYAFHYIRNTNARVNLNYLWRADGPMGRAVCLITPDGERSFGISRGIMNELPPESVPEPIIQGASALVFSTYLLRNERAPIFAATIRAIQFANRHHVPVVLSLGTPALVQEKRELLSSILRGSVSVIAGDLEALGALTGQRDPLLAGRDALDVADLVLLTIDQQGLYLAAYVDVECARETKDPIHSKSIPEYNRFEYSRAMAKDDCKTPLKIYSHINPYHGGTGVMRQARGAGDAALAALLHDIAANAHHKHIAPTSPKHAGRFITYSSIRQVCKYANRASFEALRCNSPRLVHSLAEQDNSLEQTYWEA